MFNVQPLALGKEDVCCVDFYISPLVVRWHIATVDECYALLVTFVIHDLKLILKLYSLSLAYAHSHTFHL